MLDPGLHEDSQLFFYLDDLKGMFSGDVDGVILERNGGKCTTELVCLDSRSAAACQIDESKRIGISTYPVYQSPIPTLHQKW